jgi:hypothetical protein
MMSIQVLSLHVYDADLYCIIAMVRSSQIPLKRCLGPESSMRPKTRPGKVYLAGIVHQTIFVTIAMNVYACTRLPTRLPRYFFLDMCICKTGSHFLSLSV